MKKNTISPIESLFLAVRAALARSEALILGIDTRPLRFSCFGDKPRPGENSGTSLESPSMGRERLWLEPRRFSAT
jgi:hypothetical protein